MQQIKASVDVNSDVRLLDLILFCSGANFTGSIFEIPEDFLKFRVLWSISILLRSDALFFDDGEGLENFIIFEDAFDKTYLMHELS